MLSFNKELVSTYHSLIQIQAKGKFGKRHCLRVTRTHHFYCRKLILEKFPPLPAPLEKEAITTPKRDSTSGKIEPIVGTSPVPSGTFLIDLGTCYFNVFAF